MAKKEVQTKERTPEVKALVAFAKSKNIPYRACLRAVIFGYLNTEADTQNSILAKGQLINIALSTGATIDEQTGELNLPDNHPLTAIFSNDSENEEA